MAIGDLARAMKIQPSENRYSLQLAGLYFSIGEVESGLNAVKECLRQDPEHKECKKLFRKIKAVKKQFTVLKNLQQKRKWSSILSILFTEDNFVRDVEEIGATALKKQVYMFACEGYHWIKNHDNVISYCTKVLDINSDFVDARIFRAEAFLTKDEFEAAKNDFRTVHEADGQNQRVFVY
jgi:DnaJ family protein C protein 3